MEEHYGPERGSYIWGSRSVHNVRIERLWHDVTQGFGTKWYNFFYDLEAEAGLHSESDVHIWLLHLLFLPAIDQDAADWAEAWNHHKISFDGEERERSPRDMYFFGVLQEGLRGPESVVDASGTLQHLEEEIENIMTYGVDWRDLADPVLLRHHNQHNPDEPESLGPHNSQQPPHLSLVEIPTFECPFETEEQLEIFTDALLLMPEYSSRDMQDRKSLWMQALDLLLNILPMSL
ncbi:hypothetical protein BT96DRAFT_835527 [Gymnopus androsaceus JB14]|uniref:Integrase core domain-containing protein n=1 Tax=Gymnopus androsaceus JB14 TaxID=1447944 RepID=A0A6A4GUH0_9AGAR|nr:hypothetical protein BT96DRAFT_835527 [Gymnopus androsaceus JB14]